MSKVRVNPRFSISSASSNGTTLTYTCNNDFTAGKRINVTGSSNANFNFSDLPVASATSTQFTITKAVTSGATSTGGVASTVFDEWRTSSLVQVKINGVWRKVAQTQVKIDGVWRKTTLGTPPDKPNIEYYSCKKFRILPYDSTLVYQATFTTGAGGTATLDPFTGIYTISDSDGGQVWAGFSVVARYAAGAPASASAYMEIKPQSFTAGTRYYDCPGVCQYPPSCTPGSCSCGPGPCGPGNGTPNQQCGCGNTHPCCPCMFGNVEPVCTPGGTYSCTKQCSEPISTLNAEPGYTNAALLDSTCKDWYKRS